MVFTSLPIYLDPPNWNQQPNQQPTPPPITTNLQPPGPNTDTASNPVRPGSMAERARMAKIPQPEPALKCPRCDSTNTKFCYFNNYSLSQPRHFCKSCRRYWTRGGSLRNVPVGGGSRRNAKRSTSTAASSKNSSSKNSMHSSVQGPPQQVQLPYLGDQYGSLLGLNGDLGGPGLGLDQWRIQQIHQQYPFLGGMESSSALDAALHGIYPSFDGEGDLGFGLAKPPGTSGIITQMAAVKMEDSRNHLQYLGGGWPGDLAGFSSPSLGNIL